MLEKYRSYACMELVSLICPRTKRNETKRNTGGGDLQRATCGRKSVLSTASTRRGDSRSHAATLPALLLPFCLPVVLHQLQLIIIFAKLALPRPPPRRPGPDELPYRTPIANAVSFIYITFSQISIAELSRLYVVDLRTALNPVHCAHACTLYLIGAVITGSSGRRPAAAKQA